MTDIVWLIFACALAFACGALCFRVIDKSRKKRARVRILQGKSGIDSADAEDLHCQGISRRHIALARRQTREEALYRWNPHLMRIASIGMSGFDERAKVAGLAQTVSARGFVRARLLLCAGSTLACALLGAVASSELSLSLACAGALYGWFCLNSAFRKEAIMRRDALERHLSEVIEVVCLGLRSGLSFDSSLGLYCSCFKGPLSAELALAKSQWMSGLGTRESVLRSLSATYDSPLFLRVVDNIVRSMRFGSPLAEGLEVLAAEARQCRRAAVQEKVMKAPVKMMMPVGTLILPSMLILVLGPVLLELAEGF